MAYPDDWLQAEEKYSRTLVVTFLFVILAVAIILFLLFKAFYQFSRF